MPLLYIGAAIAVRRVAGAQYPPSTAVLAVPNMAQQQFGGVPATKAVVLLEVPTLCHVRCRCRVPLPEREGSATPGVNVNSCTWRPTLLDPSRRLHLQGDVLCGDCSQESVHRTAQLCD